MASSPGPNEPLPASPAGRLARARLILSSEGRVPAPLADARARGGDLSAPDSPDLATRDGADDAAPAAAADAATDASAAAEPTERAGSASLLAFAVLTGAIKPLAAALPVKASPLARLFPPAAPGEPSRLELSALGAALVGAAFIGTTIPGSTPVQAQTAPQPQILVATTPPSATPVPAADSNADASSGDATPDTGASDTSSTDPGVAAPAVAAAPAAASDTTSTDTSDSSDTSGDSGDGSDPLAGGGGTTLGRVALVVVHGDAPARWATAPAGSASAKRAALGTTFTGLAVLPSSPLATGLAYVAGQPSNPATRAGCTTASPVTPGTVDDAGVTTGTGCDYPAQVPSIAGAVARDGRTWKAYAPGASPQEVAARLCHPTDGNGTDAMKAFAQRSPLGHLGDLTGSGACDNAASPLSSLAADLKGDSAPAWVYVEVGDCGTDGCDDAEAAARDAQLDDVLKTLGAAKDPNGGKVATLVVGDGDVAGLDAADPMTFPKPAGDPDAPAAVNSGALLIGDDVTPGSTDPLALDPLAIAKTQATWLGLTAPGLAAADGETALATPGS